MIAITMKDTMVQEIIDEEYMVALDGLNTAAGAGKTFIGMHDPLGNNILINIGNIMVAREIDEVAELS